MARSTKILFIALSVCLYTLTASAQTVRVGSSGISGELLPLWVAQDKGFFKKHGLLTEVITFPGAPPTMQSLVAGELQFGVGGGSSLVDAKIAGADLVIVAVYVDTLPYTLVASEKITSASQLKGKRFAVSRIGAISDISLRMALRNMGLNPENEAIMLGLGDQTSRFSALKSGTVDATVISPPLTVTARKLGFNVIASFQEAGIRWAFDTIDTNNAFARKNPEMVQNFLKGLIEGIAFIHKNKEESISVLTKRMRLTDREALDETYDHLKKIIQKKPFSSEAGIQAIINSTRNPKAKTFKPQDMVDMQYLRDLDKTGFIDVVNK
jgi:NitT/TauT family transport system substrate-binding protein